MVFIPAAQPRADLLALSISDDPLFGDAAMERLLADFTGCRRWRLHVRPAQIGVPAIGHFAFFMIALPTRCGRLPATGYCTALARRSLPQRPGGRDAACAQSLASACNVRRVCAAWLSTHSTAAPPPGWAARRRAIARSDDGKPGPAGAGMRRRRPLASHGASSGSRAQRQALAGQRGESAGRID